MEAYDEFGEDFEQVETAIKAQDTPEQPAPFERLAVSAMKVIDQLLYAVTEAKEANTAPEPHAAFWDAWDDHQGVIAETMNTCAEFESWFEKHGLGIHNEALPEEYRDEHGKGA